MTQEWETQSAEFDECIDEAETCISRGEFEDARQAMLDALIPLRRLMRMKHELDERKS